LQNNSALPQNKSVVTKSKQAWTPEASHLKTPTDLTNLHKWAMYLSQSKIAPAVVYPRSKINPALR